jgi:hypothetical protein
VGSLGYPGISVFIIVQVGCWPAAIVLGPQSPLVETAKVFGEMASNTVKVSPGCRLKTTPFPIADVHAKDCWGWGGVNKLIVQSLGREQLDPG